MPRLIALLAAVALAGVVGVAALNAAGPKPSAPPVVTPAPMHAPVATPAPTPVPVATPAPTPVPIASPTPAPTKPPVDAMPITVNLENVLHQDVSIDVVDRSGHLVGAVSGTPAEGASVDWYAVQVENLDPTTIRLTFTDMPGAASLGLIIDENGRTMILVRPTRDSDTIAFDRVLELTFDAPVDADQLRVVVQEGSDT